MKAITATTAIRAIKTGQWFTVTFRKRSTGEIRVMTARWGVRVHLRGGEAAYSFKDKNLICVYEKATSSYKTIPIEGLLKLKFAGEERRVTHG